MKDRDAAMMYGAITMVVSGIGADDEVADVILGPSRLGPHIVSKYHDKAAMLADAFKAGLGDPSKPQSTERKLLTWLLTGNVGASSKAIAAHLSGIHCDGSYPHDASDFLRCVLLLEAVPELCDELPRMAEVNAEWKALVEHWDEIESLFRSEVWKNLGNGRSAPATYKLMCEVLKGAKK